MWRSYLSGARTAVETALPHILGIRPRRGRGPGGAPPLARARQPERESTESGGLRGYEAAKKIKGRKRHILTDTEGNLVHAVVHTADIHDRDGAPLGWPKIIRRFPWLRHVFADGGYAGAKLKDALRQIGKWTIEIVKRSDAAKGFVVLPPNDSAHADRHCPRVRCSASPAAPRTPRRFRGRGTSAGSSDRDRRWR